MNLREGEYFSFPFYFYFYLLKYQIRYIDSVLVEPYHFGTMTENTTNEDTKEDKEAFASVEAAIMPPDKSAQTSYCVKTVQENSASLVRMVS